MNMNRPTASSLALTRHWLMLAACMLALFVAGFSFSAHAQMFGSVNSAMSCGGGGSNMLNSGSCPSTIEDGKIFSYFVCNMEKLIGEVFGQFYCQLNQQFMAPMTAVITLAILLFGIAFMIGVVQATAREFVVFLIKVACVWAFATQSYWLIGIAYTFFMGGLKDGIAIVVSGLFHPSGASGFSPSSQGGQQIYEYMDSIFQKFVTFSTESAGADPNGGTSGAGGGSGGTADYCKNAVFAGMALLMLAFPPLFIFSIFLLIKFVMFFLRAVFGYIYAVMGISFLIVLAPIFLSFLFWRETRQYFDKWIGHLAAFAIQMVIIFAFIAFILSMDVSSVAKDLMNLVVPNKTAVQAPGIKWPWQVCTICKFHVEDSNGAAVSGGNVPPGGTAKCNSTPGEPIDPAALMGPSENGDRDTLLKLASRVILTLVVLAYVVNALLDLVPQIAQRIASANLVVAPNLVDAETNPLPLENSLQTAAQAFSDRVDQGGNPITAFSDAFKQSSSALLSGSRSGKGLIQNLGDWLGNP